MKIVVKRRFDDYHVSIEGHPKSWDCGKNIPEAIGNLVMSCHDQFKIEVEVAEKVVPRSKK